MSKFTAARQVFIGVRGGGVGEGDLKVATSLKGLCELIQVPYSSAKFRGGGAKGSFWEGGVWMTPGARVPVEVVAGKDPGFSSTWLVKRVSLAKVANRGRGGDGKRLNAHGLSNG